MGRLQDLYVNKMREHLKQVAQDMIEKAQREYDPEVQTGTQMDSYGALIFYNGALVYTLAPTHKDLTRQHFGISAYQYKDDEKHRGWGDIPPGTGVEWGRLLRNEIKSGAWGKIPEKGFCLIIFNAAFYTAKLESGAGLKHKYRVLSMIASDMSDVQSKMKGSILRWHNLNV